MKEHDPESFADALFVDRALRETPASRDAIKGTAFHPHTPYALSGPNLDETESYTNLLLEECEGLARYDGNHRRNPKWASQLRAVSAA